MGCYLYWKQIDGPGCLYISLGNRVALIVCTLLRLYYIIITPINGGANEY